MPNPTYLVVKCPTCDRRLLMRVEHLGERMACQHCQGRFIVPDPRNPRRECTEPGNSLLSTAVDVFDMAMLLWPLV
jgi:DNA-directed RNA polymerase subunit RPC12/RpoP